MALKALGDIGTAEGLDYSRKVQSKLKSERAKEAKSNSEIIDLYLTGFWTSLAVLASTPPGGGVPACGLLRGARVAALVVSPWRSCCTVGEARAQ